ncbi:LysE family translocator [Rhizobium sp. NRK18]|uniref:LysE family translocator n=1 Tax=Rhizobium sp. NRK18 TaxID=2964667 RepID=UPI0021C2A9F2|nr:LysE family translocator [Rhizobium sp. NRK18]MCQ2004479.1 LysE family translocator [Rhizobium sp. NRK18]
MPSSDILIAFFLTTLAFAYLPGPAMLYAAAQTVARGRFAGLMAALGIHLGGYVHVAASAAGLSILFHAVPPLYVAVKLAGALYLVWLGVCFLRAKAGSGVDIPEANLRTGRQAFMQSVAIEVLNPKTALFFLAFLPQFVDAAASFPIWLQLTILGTMVNLIFSSADIVCVGIAGDLVARLRRSGRVQLMARRAGGAMLVGLGVHLALQKS